MHRPLSMLAALVGLALTLPGCADDATHYPSLSPRPAEKLGFAEPDVKAVELTPDPALDATMADKRTQLAGIAKGFADAETRSGVAVRAARGHAVGSDAWLEAQTSLAGLDDYRAQTSALATDIDTLIADRAAALAPVYPTLSTLRDDVEAEAAKEGGSIDRLQATLPAG